jgi:hypothetical protein
MSENNEKLEAQILNDYENASSPFVSFKSFRLGWLARDKSLKEALAQSELLKVNDEPKPFIEQNQTQN